jgi:hypothetical protein
MEIRYLGFDQRMNSRVYRFDVRVDGNLTKQVVISADLSIFHDHRVGIQEGPVLSGNKLRADLERGWEGEHELTSADVQAFADSRAFAEAQRIAARKEPRRRVGGPGETPHPSPWRGSGV